MAPYYNELNCKRFILRNDCNLNRILFYGKIVIYQNNSLIFSIISLFGIIAISNYSDFFRYIVINTHKNDM